MAGGKSLRRSWEAEEIEKILAKARNKEKVMKLTEVFKSEEDSS